ncbi:MAG: TIGR00266 family protein [Ruminococcus sp.]|nr:TIGR00266 family protein [Ruminococcus sp.]
MKYEIMGGNFPAVLCKLNKGEKIVCEGGAMSWMDDKFTMETSGGGVKKMFGRAFSGESLFLNTYTADEDGEIAFASSFPGQIVAVEIGSGRSVIAQKKAFLACFGDVDMSVFFQKKLSGGFFGGEGFILEKYSGSGVVFLEIDGSVKEYTLAPGERKIMDTGHMVMMDDTCTMDVQTVKGIKNKFLGGEGLFNTVVTGPGRIVIQTMPIVKTAEIISNLIPKSSN